MYWVPGFTHTKSRRRFYFDSLIVYQHSYVRSELLLLFTTKSNFHVENSHNSSSFMSLQRLRNLALTHGFIMQYFTINWHHIETMHSEFMLRQNIPPIFTFAPKRTLFRPQYYSVTVAVIHSIENTLLFITRYFSHSSTYLYVSSLTFIRPGAPVVSVRLVRFTVLPNKQ